MHLPKSVSLEGSWKCGLAEIQYPRSWYTVAQPSKYWIYYRQGKVKVSAHLPLGYFQNPLYAIDLLNRWLETVFTTTAEEAVRNNTTGVTLATRILMNLRFNTNAQIATLIITDTEAPDTEVKFSDELAHMLGFDETQYDEPGVYVASRVVNLNGIDVIFVYTDIIQSRIIGNTLVPLQDVIAIQGRPCKMVCRRFDKPFTNQF